MKYSRQRCLTLAILLLALAEKSSVVETRVADVDSATDTLLCGHYCILQCARQCGIQLETQRLGDILPLRPPSEGHNLLELCSALQSIGLKTRALEVTEERLLELPVPFVAYLENPSHFVAVAAISDERVFVSSKAGPTDLIPMDKFLEGFSGKVSPYLSVME